MTTARQGGSKSNAKTESGSSSALTGHESELWRTAENLRGGMNAAGYKHVIPGIIFLEHISEIFEETYVKLEAERNRGTDPEDPDEYLAHSIFRVPPEARWQHLKNRSRHTTGMRLLGSGFNIRRYIWRLSCRRQICFPSRCLVRKIEGIDQYH